MVERDAADDADLVTGALGHFGDRGEFPSLARIHVDDAGQRLVAGRHRRSGRRRVGDERSGFVGGGHANDGKLRETQLLDGDILGSNGLGIDLGGVDLGHRHAVTDEQEDVLGRFALSVRHPGGLNILGQKWHCQTQRNTRNARHNRLHEVLLSGF